MITASTSELLEYLAHVIVEMERYGATILPADGGDELDWLRRGDDLMMDVTVWLPADRRSRPADLVLRERWRSHGRDEWQMVEYGYELRDQGLGYRRALHRHDDEYFVRSYGVATHEHCESTMGYETCGHYQGEPASGALDGFLRLYGVWLTGQKPDCSTLQCLG
jgi:hypothetical protein